MTLVTPDELKAAIIAKLKANVTIVAIFGDEIREVQYQGTEYSYPALRVRINNMSPITGKEDCAHFRFTCSMYSFSESDNSLEADQNAGIIYKELHGKQSTSNNIAMSFNLSNLIPAIRSDIRTWRAEIIWNGIASKIG